MAWDEAPPTKDELAWASSAPTQEELTSLRTPAVNASPNNVSYLESGLRGATDILGLEPVVVGGAKTLLHPSNWSNLADAYAKASEEERNKNEAAFKANPKTYLAGSLLGGTAATLATGGLGAPAAEAGGLARLAQLAKGGAALGTIQGAAQGSTELAKGNLGEAAEDVVKGALGGGLLGGASGIIEPAVSVLPKAFQAPATGAILGGALGGATGEGVVPGAVAGGVAGHLVSKITPEKLEEIASNKALSALGPTKSQIKNLRASPSFEEGELRSSEVGKRLLEKNPYTNKQVLGMSPETTMDNLEELEQKSGQEIGQILNYFDKSAEKDADIKYMFYSPSESIEKVKALQDQFTKNGEILPLYKNQYGSLQDAIDTLAQFGKEGPITFKDANELKNLISKTAYNDEGKLTNDLMGQVRGIINDDIETAADNTAKALGEKQISDQYLEAKDWYRTAKESSNILKGKLAGEISNRDLGITDYISAGAGAAIHGVPGAAGAAIGNKLYRKYGNAVIAKSARAASETLSGINQQFTKMTKENLAQYGQQLAASEDPIKSRIGQVLQKASERDEIGKNALIFAVMQNPEYRKALGQETNIPSVPNKKNVAIGE